MRRNAYPGELTDKEWKLIEKAVTKKASPRGRKPKYPKREMIDAIFYLLRSGCSWRLLPHDFPPWQAVYSQFVRWRDSGLFEKLNKKLRGKLRVLAERDKEPSAAILDSQSVKTTEKGGSVGTMLARKSKVEKDISRSIRWGTCYRRLSRVRKKVIRKVALDS